jgi:alpha-tubulin suppressor-like RCC1 family protein
MGPPTVRPRTRRACRLEPQTLLGLPPELLTHTFSLLRTADLGALAAVSLACARAHVPAALRARAALLGYKLPPPRAGEAPLAALRFVELVAERPRATLSADTCHTACVRAGGRAYSWGGHENGPPEEEEEEAPVPGTSPPELRCWASHLGHGQHVGVCVPAPRPIAGLGAVVVVEVAAGYEHTLLLTQARQVWSCGAGDYGRLGHGGFATCAHPRRVRWAVGGPPAGDAPAAAPAGVGESLWPQQQRVDFEEVVQVSAGGFQSLALTADGRCWSWGWGDSGSLGHGHSVHVLEPRAIEALAREARIVQASAGSGHSLFVGERGALYACGDHRHGKLGLGQLAADVCTPQRVRLHPRVRARQASAWHAHSLVVTASGGLYAFGCGANGRLGLGDELSRWRPAKVQALRGVRVCHAAAGEQHSVVQSAAGEAYTFGDPAMGQTGTMPPVSEWSAVWPLYEHVLVPTRVPLGPHGRVVEVAVGDHHTVLRCEDGTLLAFGKNEEGQLGLGVDSPDCVYTPTPVSWAPAGGAPSPYSPAPPAGLLESPAGEA